MSDSEKPVVKYFAQVPDDPTVMTEILVREDKLKADIKRGIWEGVNIWRVDVGEPKLVHAA
jgi:hypothetical protein